MRKPIIFALAGTVLVLAIGVVIFFFAGKRWLESTKAMAMMPWKTTVELTGAVKVDSPYPLSRKEVPLDAEGNRIFQELVSHEGSKLGTTVVLETFHIQPEAIPGLDKAVGLIEIFLRSKVAGLPSGRRTERSVFGARAIELEADYVKLNQTLRMRSLFFMRSNVFYQVRLVSRANSPDGDLIWEKMKASVRLADGSGAGVKARAQQAIQRAPDEPVMPPGMRRRNHPAEPAPAEDP